MDDELITNINSLKKQNDAVILGHFYINEEVQEIADYVGDSYYLSKLATTLPQKTICFAGVKFMAESAKILNPQKTVLMPDIEADCPMAHMVSAEQIKKVRAEVEDLAVVCYINSTTEIKCECDVIVTSANAIKIVKKLQKKNILFIPDQNLGKFVAKNVPEKNFIFLNGHCPIHFAASAQEVAEFKEKHQGICVMSHPECSPEILEQSDFVGSTSQIIKAFEESDKKEFLILTESGIAYELKKRANGKKIFFLENDLCCDDMKKITLEKVEKCLQNKENEIFVSEETRQKALLPLEKMLELSK